MAAMVIATLALGVSIVALVVALATAFRGVDIHFLGQDRVEKMLDNCCIWPLRETEQLKAFDAMPGVLVCFGGSEQQRWLGDHLKRWYRVTLTQVEGIDLGKKS